MTPIQMDELNDVVYDAMIALMRREAAEIRRAQRR